MTSTQPCTVICKGFFSSAEGFATPDSGRPHATLPGLLLDFLVCVRGDGGCPHASRHSHSSLSPQAIQHIEGTQERQEQEEEQRRAVIVKPVRSCPEAQASDTASDTEASDSDTMDQSREEPAGTGGLP